MGTRLETRPRYTPTTCFETISLPARRVGRLHAATCHAKLDAAVAAAYGFPADLTDEAILERLLALNLAGKGLVLPPPTQEDLDLSKCDP